jgi:hypothetical protein
LPAVRGIFEYGPGIPRYLGYWLVVTPLLLGGLRLLGVRRGALVVLGLSTLPTLARNPPVWFPLWVRAPVLAAGYAVVAAWLVARARAGHKGPAPRGGRHGSRRPAPVPWGAVVALCGAALAARVTLAWWDPGISDIATSTEIAAHQLLSGTNPFVAVNPDTQVGRYQYPAGTVLAHVPFVWAMPEVVAGEGHMGVRTAVWAGDLATIVLLAWAGARLGRPRAGLAAALAYGLHPVVLREAGQTVANDLLLTGLAAGAAVALSRGRHLLAGGLTGAAISVKPAAAALVPLLVVAGGWPAALLAVGVPVLVQAPFLLWPTPGWHGLRWIAEPVGRPDAYAVLRANSLWWPLYALAGAGPAVVRAAEGAALAVTGVAAVWAGRRARGAALGGVAAAVALPLFASWALASMQRTNYQCWYLAPFCLAVGLTVRERAPAAPQPAPLTAVA